MAKFLKIPLTGVANTPEQLIAIDQVVSVIPGDVAGPGANPTTKTRILLNAINAALTANPGGVVSTVGSPVSVAQVPQQPSISGAQGRTVVTTAQVDVTYTSALYTP